MAVKDVKLSREMQMYLMMDTIVVSLLIVFLFNIFWAPVLFMVVTSYFIMNKDRALTKNELLIIFVIVFFLIYCMVARLFGRGPGILIVFIPLLVLVLSYVLMWRKSR